MSWNYRIVKRRDGLYAVHIVTYDVDGRAISMTQEPVDFKASVGQGGVSALRRELNQMFNDIKRFPVFEEPSPGKWPGKQSGSG